MHKVLTDFLRTGERLRRTNKRRRPRLKIRWQRLAKDAGRLTVLGALRTALHFSLALISSSDEIEAENPGREDAK